jgi:hypothetical protein
MSTQKQINANRKNAQKSTGPRTAEGKAAVSQNAVKHGLFTDSLVFGENLADYEAFHDQMLAELDPAGAVETTMAERIISLWWRLKRAEHMQNEVIEDMILRKVTNDSSRRCREYDLADHGLRPDDPEYDLDGLALGRIGTKDFACCRVLDRMLMYERRIENSVIRLTKELRKQQLMRRIKQQNMSQEQAIAQTEALMGKKVNLKKQSQSRLAPNTAGGLLTDLKKQSQFMPGLMDVTPFVKEGYGDNSPAGDVKNKANQSQLKARIGFRPESPNAPEVIQGGRQ